MPNDRYLIRKVGKGKAYVVSAKTGKRHSKKALPLSKAIKQQRAIYRSESMKKGK